MQMQVKPRAYEAGLPGLRISEFMVAACAQNAKAYWSWWGPLGTPMIRSIEAWEDMQRGYLQQLSGAPGVVKSTEEAERSFTKVEAAVEAPAASDESEHPRDAGGQFAEAKQASAWDESEHPRGAGGQFVEVPPIEDYDSLNVQEVRDQLGEMNVEEIKELRAYEAEHKNRQSLLDRVDAVIDASPAIKDYDSLNVQKVREQLGVMSVEEIKELRAYEAEHKNRQSLLDRIDAVIDATSS